MLGGRHPQSKQTSPRSLKPTVWIVPSKEVMGGGGLRNLGDAGAGGARAVTSVKEDSRGEVRSENSGFFSDRTSHYLKMEYASIM